VLSKVRDDDKFNAHKAAWDHAMELYHQGNYAAAISEFEIILKDDPDNQACNFYAAVSYLGLENEDAALKKLKKLDNNKNGPYYEASRWYEGLAYVKKGEKKEAIKALEKVVELNGEYKPKAMELLEQLK
jgi:tetratricopeptide (TPR) repeat protein